MTVETASPHADDRGRGSRGWGELETAIHSLRKAVAVAELKDGVLVPAGLVKFVLGGKELWHRLDRLRAATIRSGVVPVRPELVAGVAYFGRYRSGAIRDGVLLSVG